MRGRPDFDYRKSKVVKAENLESSSSDETITESSANEDESEKEGEEPEKERKKKKLVYKDPANKKSKVKKERKIEKSKKGTNVSTSAESRRSSRKQVIEQRFLFF